MGIKAPRCAISATFLQIQSVLRAGLETTLIEWSPALRLRFRKRGVLSEYSAFRREKLVLDG